MDILLAFKEVNYLAVLVAAVVYFGLGAVWYSSALFSREWMEDIGKTSPELKQGANMPRIMIASFVMYFLMCLTLAAVLGTGATLASGVNMGLLFGLGFLATSLASNMLYERKPLRLFLINAGYGVLGLVVAGMIIGAWQ